MGIDVSPPCIAMARQVAAEENVQESECKFFEVDATIDSDILLAGEFLVAFVPPSKVSAQSPF